MRIARISTAVVAVAAAAAALTVFFWPGPGPEGDTGCPGTARNTIVDWIPFLRFDGRTYESAVFEAPERVGRSKVGAEIGKVTCHLSSYVKADRPTSSLPDGTAPFLPVGTPIHRLVDRPVECGVAVPDEGDFIVYVAHHEVNGRSVPSCPDEAD